MSKHLVLVLQSRKSFFKLRVFVLQVFHSVFQLTQVSLFPLSCLLSRNSIPQQPFHHKLRNNPITQPLVTPNALKGKNVKFTEEKKTTNTSLAACSLSPPVSSLASFDFLRPSPASAPDLSLILILDRKFLSRQLLLRTPELAVSPHRFQFLNKQKKNFRRKSLKLFSTIQVIDLLDLENFVRRLKICGPN